MITNYDDQIKILGLILDIMSKIRDDIPHLESWMEARGYLSGSTTVLKRISEELPPDLNKEIIQYIDTEIKVSNTMIDRLRNEGLL